MCYVQARCFDVIHGWRGFGKFIVVMLCINTIFQMASYYYEPHSWFVLASAIDAVLVAIYAVEVALKIGAETDLRCALCSTLRSARLSGLSGYLQNVARLSTCLATLS